MRRTRSGLGIVWKTIARGQTRANEATNNERKKARASAKLRTLLRRALRARLSEVEIFLLLLCLARIVLFASPTHVRPYMPQKDLPAAQ